jgi:O-antigen/teichoic acid export membrane protein
VLEAAFIGLDRTKFNSLIMTVQACAKIVLSPLLILVGLSVLGALLGQLLSYVIVVPVGLASLSFILYKSHDDPMSGSARARGSDIFKEMLKYGMPLYIGGLFAMFLGQYQTLVLAYFASNTEIGNFQVALIFQSSTALITYPFITLFPAFSKLKVENGQISQFFRRSVKYTSVLILPAVAALAVLSKDLIYTFFGSAYALAPTFLTFYVLMGLYSGLGSIIFGYLFMGIGRTDVVLKSNLISLLVFLPLAPLLTFLFGVMGLILSLFIINFCELLYFLAMTRKQIKTGPDFRASAKIFAATALSAVVLIAFLRVSPFSNIPNLILGAILLLLVYPTLLPILGVLNQADMEIFKQMFHKIKGVRFILKLFISYETKILGYKQRLSNQN